MGRESGYIALMGGLAGGAEIILIPEEPTSLQRVASRVVEGLASGKRHSIVVVAEGFPIERRGGYEAVSAGRRIADVLEADRGLETRLTILGHLQRGGSPSAFDRILASRFGEAAVRYHAEGRTGEMTALSCGDVTGIPLDEIEKPGSHVDLALYRLAHTIAH